MYGQGILNEGEGSVPGMGEIEKTMISNLKNKKKFLRYWEISYLFDWNFSIQGERLEINEPIQYETSFQWSVFKLGAYTKEVPFRCSTLGYAKALLTNRRGLPGTNTLAYYENLQVKGVKSFITVDLDWLSNYLNHVTRILLKVA
jgi:hypothetical protein